MPKHHYDPKIFTAVTAERGLKYFQTGAVALTQRRGQRYYARVSGSYNYQVWLELSPSGQLLRGSCDCPVYEACKHMAALWFALQEANENTQDELEGLLSRQKEKDLRALLLRLAEDVDVKERLLTLLVPEKSADLYAAQVKKLIKLPRAGYDYHAAIELGFSVRSWLQQVAASGDAVLAQVLPLLIPRLMSALQMADDSEAEITDAMNEAISLLAMLLMEPPYPQALIDFLDKCLKNPDYFDFGNFGWDLYQLRAQVWQAQGEFEAWGKWLDAKAQSSSSEWTRETCLEYKLEMLQESRQNAAAQQLLADNLHLPSFRQKALDAAQKAKDWPRMEALLLEGITLAEQKNHYGTLSDWQKALLPVWQKMGKPIRQLAQELAFDDGFDTHYYHLWKKSIPAKEWPAEWEKLLKSLARKNHAISLHPLLLEEKRFDLLLDSFRQARFLHDVEGYLPQFPAEYSDALLEVFLPLLENSIALSTSRGAYKRDGLTIKRLKKLFPKHKPRIQAFSDEMKSRYSHKPRRPAMLSEWVALGL